ncbi:MAG: ASKHA domain-containing protein [Desulfobulbaceae bacterium]|nr:ASKHA domain-containing protein [Desulfobulbaceae bacterium]
MAHTIIFQPDGARAQCADGDTLLTVSGGAGIELETPCGGAGNCGKCLVRVENQAMSAITEPERESLSTEEIAMGFRLACQCRAHGDMTVFIPETSRQSRQIIVSDGRAVSGRLKPGLACLILKLDKPSLNDPRDDWQRLSEALAARDFYNIKIDYTALRQLPGALRAGAWTISVVLWQAREIIAVFPGEKEKIYGAAIDIGTTTLAGFLGDLTAGEIVAQAAAANSQVRFGDDVISRVSHCMMEDDGLERLNRAIIGDVNQLLERMRAKAGVDKGDVLDMTVVFNTVMHHIFLGIRPDWLGRAPFTAAVRGPLNIKARDVGLALATGAYLHCLPIEAGFVGADNVAVLLTQRAAIDDEQTTLVIDIGTNGEINLIGNGRVLAASCATGPAFEGAQIKHGMRAAPGAIEHLTIDPEQFAVTLATIGRENGVKARGICGSGIIDAVAELRKVGLLLADGRFNKEIDCPRLRLDEKGKYEFVLVWATESATGHDIALTQKDIRAIQLAKAALYAGARLLLRRMKRETIDRVILAGAFGSYIRVESALAIGLFPDCPVEQVEVVGNAAGVGARIALFDVDMRREAARLAAMAEFVETATDPDFQNAFASAMYFPPWPEAGAARGIL